MHNRKIIDGALILNVRLDSKYKQRSLVLICKLDLEKMHDRMVLYMLKRMVSVLCGGIRRRSE